jgi:hypothetical protein
MAQQFPLTEPAPARRGRGAIISGLVLLGMGIVLVVVGVVGFGATASSLISGLGSPQTTPTELTKTLEAGTTYAVYELATSGSGETGDPYLGNIEPGDVTVTSPDGSAVLVNDAPSLTQTFNDGPRSYIVVATFDAPTTGSYVVSIATEGSTVIVAPSFTAIAQALPWLGMMGFGGLLALIGIVLLIVGLVRRSAKPAVAATYPASGYPVQSYPPPTDPAQTYPEPTAQQPPAYQAPAPDPQPTGLPAAGWYPDPERPGGQRYWNGSGWTENRA